MAPSSPDRVNERPVYGADAAMVGDLVVRPSGYGAPLFNSFSHGTNGTVGTCRTVRRMGTETASLREVRDSFGRRVDAAHFLRDITVITKNGEKRAILIPFSDDLLRAVNDHLAAEKSSHH